MQKKKTYQGAQQNKDKKNLTDHIRVFLNTDNLTDGQKTYLENLIEDKNLTDHQKYGFFQCYYKVHNVKKEDAESIKKDSSFQKFLKNVNFQELLKNFSTSEKEKVGDAQKLTEVFESKPTLKGQKKLHTLIIKLYQANKLTFPKKKYLKNLESSPDLTDKQKLKFFTAFCRKHDLVIPTIDKNVIINAMKKEANSKEKKLELEKVKEVENFLRVLKDITFNKERELEKVKEVLLQALTPQQKLEALSHLKKTTYTRNREEYNRK